MGISSALGSSALLPAGLGFRNKVINGAMVVAQRGTAAVTASGTEQFPVDRFGAVNTVGTVTFQQSSTAPAGFSKSIVATVTGTGSYSTSGYTALFHRIEGYNVADCGFGTASAKQMTLSFWVQSSVIGTYSVSFGNNAGNRWLYRNFTVNAANTWEYKTVQFVGDISGTWTTDNTTGLSVSFQLGRGTSTDGTENTWSSSTIVSSAGNVDFAANSGATFYVTGVQLEQNYQPTPFEQRPYGVELQLCQRYYWQADTFQVPSLMQSGFDNKLYAPVTFFNGVAMRATPTAAITSTPYVTDMVSNLRNITSVSMVTKMVTFSYDSTKLTSLAAYAANFNDAGRTLSLSAEL